MKIKNVEIGGYIQSKKDSKQLIAGHCYQVAEKDVSDKTVRLFSLDDSFDDSLWFCVSDFRKPRPQPQLKQLDQSVFDGLDEKWRFAAVDADGSANGFDIRVYPRGGDEYGLFTYESDYANSDDNSVHIGTGYDTSNWQNSLIERDTEKELLEVDLSSELTGSELCKAMLARGDEYVVCLVSNVADSHAVKNREHTTLIEQWVERDGFYNYRSQNWGHAVPANPATNEPLTASEVGL